MQIKPDLDMEKLSSRAIARFLKDNMDDEGLVQKILGRYSALNDPKVMDIYRNYDRGGMSRASVEVNPAITSKLIEDGLMQRPDLIVHKRPISGDLMHVNVDPVGMMNMRKVKLNEHEVYKRIYDYQKEHQSAMGFAPTISVANGGDPTKIETFQPFLRGRDVRANTLKMLKQESPGNDGELGFKFGRKVKKFFETRDKNQYLTDDQKSVVSMLNESGYDLTDIGATNKIVNNTSDNIPGAGKTPHFDMWAYENDKHPRKAIEKLSSDVSLRIVEKMSSVSHKT